MSLTICSLWTHFVKSDRAVVGREGVVSPGHAQLPVVTPQPLVALPLAPPPSAHPELQMLTREELSHININCVNGLDRAHLPRHSQDRLQVASKHWLFTTDMSSRDEKSCHHSPGS